MSIHTNLNSAGWDTQTKVFHWDYIVIGLDPFSLPHIIALSNFVGGASEPR